MKVDIELARSSLETAKTGWYRYLGTLWLLYLIIIIDTLTERQFLCGTGNISFFDLEVSRFTFSFTYSALFGTFIVWAAGSARTTQEIICASSEDDLFKVLSVSPEYRLWGLSPVNRSMGIRFAFWLLSGNGLFLLLVVTVIHLGKYNLPDSETMTPELYQGVGIFSAAILVLSVFLILRWIYPAWRSVYRWFSEGGKR
jgi:hypothetical protein